MELKNQVCSLDLAKRLKELGVKQESLFWWVNQPNGGLRTNGYQWYLESEPRTRHKTYDYISAFTVAELGQLLPPLYISMQTREDGWCVCPKEVADEKADYYDERVLRANTEANARAKMLVYLLENKIITL